MTGIDLDGGGRCTGDDPASLGPGPRQPAERFGDVFPLPVFFPAVSSVGAMGRRAQQRIRRREILPHKVAETAAALNVLAGHHDSTSWPTSASNLAQRTVERRIHAAHAQRVPPVDVFGPEAALRQLLRKGALYQSGPGQLAPYAAGRLSLPRGQASPVPLRDLLVGEDLQDYKNFTERIKLSSEELGAVWESCIDAGCYNDPAFDDPHTYAAFLSDLESADMIGYTVSPKVRVGCFCVRRLGESRVEVRR